MPKHPARRKGIYSVSTQTTLYCRPYIRISTSEVSIFDIGEVRFFDGIQIWTFAVVVNNDRRNATSSLVETDREGDRIDVRCIEAKPRRRLTQCVLGGGPCKDAQDILSDGVAFLAAKCPPR